MQGKCSQKRVTLTKYVCRKQTNRYVDVRKMIFVDSHILNYSNFYPGKMLGSTLSVGNLSNCEQIVELSVDAANLSYKKE